MLSFSPSVRILLCREPTDMRRAFDGLARMVVEALGENPFSGHLFVFRNKRGDRLKILYWDRDGYALWYKRLEEGVFRFPKVVDGRAEVSAAELALILEGIDVTGLKRRKRYARP
jgi:transposase